MSRPASKYIQRTDGEWVHWSRRGHLVACCDCGLVHLMKPRRTRGRVEISAVRMPLQTNGRRRKKGLIAFCSETEAEK